MNDFCSKLNKAGQAAAATSSKKSPLLVWLEKH
jgi:hypothetical protein